MIRLLALDIDGVLTDGTVAFDERGTESKSLFFRDIDAVHAARRAGIELALVSGEATPIVALLAGRLGIDRVLSGRKDKDDALRELAAETQLTLDEICYVGDAPRDAAALTIAGLGLAPADASAGARAAADHVLESNGGRGAVEEAVGILLEQRGLATGEAVEPR